MIGKIESVLRYGKKIQSKIREFKKSRFRSPEWRNIRENFLDENPFCEACGSHKSIQVHHIRPFHIFPELELDTNNLIGLCMDVYNCHLNIGHGGNFSFYNPGVKDDAKKFRNAANRQERLKVLTEANYKRLR